MVISACQHACPAGIDVPNYVAAIAKGNYEQSVDIIRERNPFPAVCGRICIHPCEFKCRRGELDDPVAIRSLKRYASDWYFENIDKPEKPYIVVANPPIVNGKPHHSVVIPVEDACKSWALMIPMHRVV